MASFVEELWSSIFTAGPTPTLLLATNTTFAALQTLLFVLLLATYSIHFVILSILSGALWYSINWFAQELKQSQGQSARQEISSEKTAETAKFTESDAKTRGTTEGADSDTETEHVMSLNTGQPSESAPQSATASTSLQVPDGSSEVRKRLSLSGDSSGYASTDSEWEKVDDKSAK
ncbi:V-type ATPase assembly factor PKR1 [Aspergillus nidulans FGSC A4]|uniref:ER membrane protein (Pkr1), putative (AFU_orthologue AFUA_2G05200) n=1 Tax=Emericella nidulans (strain FGSC A4 / ATCC 38163 / CBS 112.46 / NRRL 194 / M139) TaxID=227321 RepID=C8VLY9_EMENI|nr:hypothetical protein [Aspergillus nidulans FGSC A4]CBF86196.1 TPA: ER membrane protein (Pkr1), putative (AFU_orthologue; AFUA_2G05200) [Aspergillus nidulans FGSC A4]